MVIVWLLNVYCMFFGCFVGCLLDVLLPVLLVVLLPVVLDVNVRAGVGAEIVYECGEWDRRNGNRLLDGGEI